MLHTAGLVSFAAHITQHFPCHYQGVHAFIHQQHVCTLARLNRPHTQSLIAHQEAKESARNVTGAHPIVVVAAEAVAAAAAEAAAAAAARAGAAASRKRSRGRRAKRSRRRRT